MESSSISSYTLVTCSEQGTVELFDLTKTSEMAAMHPDMVLEFWRAGMVRSAGRAASDEPVFDMSAVRRLRAIENLRLHQEVKLRTLRLIFDLVDRLESAEEELRKLRDRI